jgi:hypothetical protein
MSPADRVMARDLILLNIEMFTEWELAQAIREHLVTLEEVKTALRVRVLWDDSD